MTFILGCLSILQIFCLPGIILKNILKLNNTLIFNLIKIIILSLIINYFLITFLIYFKIYTKEVLLFIIFLELIFILINLDYGKKKINIDFSINSAITIFTFLLIVFALLKNTGNVFYSWDAVISYNEWAINFSNSIYPGGMVRPELIPKLWSMTYLITSSEIEFFAKFTTVIYPILILLVCLDEILVNKKPSNYLKLFLFCLFFYYQRNFILTGYVDTALVAIVTIFFYLLNRKTNYKTQSLQATTILVSLGIKLSGLFALFYFLSLKKSSLIIKVIVLVITLLYFIVLYFNSFHNFFGQTIFNEMGQLDDFNLKNKIWYSLSLLKDNNLFYLLLISFFGLLLNETRRILFLFIFPGIIYWILFLSYDIRNMLFTIPAIIIVNSILIEKVLMKIKLLNNFYVRILNFKKKNIISLSFNFKIIYSLIFSLLIFFSIIFNNEKLKFNDLRTKNEMRGNKILNYEILKLLNEDKIDKDNFITDFQLLFYIPMFKNVFNWQDNYLDNNKKNFEKYDYFLIYGHQNKIRDFINYKVNTKELKIIKEINNFILAGKN